MLQLLVFIIDCRDPMELAAFYSQVTGRPIVEGSGDTMAGISLGDVDLAFQRVGDYRPPRGPDGEHPKQYRLDFEVSEIEPEQHRVVELGRRCRRTSSAPTATAGRSSRTRPGIPSACAATKGSCGPATKRRGPDHGFIPAAWLSPHPPRFRWPPGQVIPALPGHDNAPAHSPARPPMFRRPSVKHVLGLIRKASSGTRHSEPHV
jgi:hypothetical protein